MEKKILDVTCGARSIWFNKHHPAAVYCDKRREQYHHLWKNAGNCTLDINPDVVCDFTDLPFQDNSFSLVVFDPPHLTGAKETAWLVKKYGKLDDNWPQMIHDGFRECMRVLKPDGVLIFKLPPLGAGNIQCRCTKCGRTPDVETPFCAWCGVPMTDEAVEMVMERLEALKDGKGD